MNHLKEYIKNKIENLKTIIKRFPISFCFLSLCTLISIVMIITDKDYMHLVCAFIFGGLLSLLLELSREYGLYNRKYIPVALSSICSLFMFLLLKAYDNAYVYTAFAGLCIALISAILYVLYRGRNNEKLFSYLIKSALISSVFSSVVMSGLSVCLAAVHLLIIDIPDVYKWYAILGILVDGLFNISLFLSSLPAPNKDIEVPVVYRTIIHKGLFYIYLLLIGILYLYIIKIVFTQNMPVGRLNWFGCFALLFYVFFYLTVDETDGKVQKMYKTSGAYLLIPILAIQLYANYIRVSAYGLTTARYASLLLIAVAVGFMLTSITKMPVTRGFLFLSVLAVLVTCTNMNIYDVPNHDQERILRNALSKGGALTSNKIDDKVQMEPEYLEDAKAAYEYLRWSTGNKSQFFNDFKETEIAKSFDSYGYIKDLDARYFDFTANKEKTKLDIKSFNQLVLVNSYNNEDLISEVAQKEIISQYAEMDLYESNELPCYWLSSNEVIYFTSISCSYDGITNDISYFYWEGMLLTN